MVDRNGFPLDRCLKLPSAINPPFSFFIPRPDGSEIFAGITVEIWRILSQHFNFCYEVVKKKNSLHLIEDLRSGAGDFAAGIIAIDPEKKEGLDFEVAYVLTHSIIYKRPTQESDLLGFVKPFTAFSWAGIGISLLFMTATWFIFGRFLDAVTSKLKAKTKGFSSTFISCARVLLSQDLTFDHEKVSKLVLGLWMIMSLIIGTFYKSNLKAMLITKKVSLPFDSIEEFVETDIPLALGQGSALYTSLKRAGPETSLGKMLKKAIVLGRVDIYETRAKVRKGVYAYSALSPSLQWSANDDFKKTGNCAFHIASKHFLPVNMAIMMSKGAPYNEKLKKAISSLIESGIQKKLLDDIMKDSSNCKMRAKTATLRPMSITDFLGVLSLFGVGVVLAMVVFISEVIFSRCNRRTPDGSEVSQANQTG